MAGADRGRLPSILLFSSGNPAATFLTAGLLHGRFGHSGSVTLQGIGPARPAPEVTRVLGEQGVNLRDWAPQIGDTPPTEQVEVGITICVPT
jgi:hypothetical protein